MKNTIVSSYFSRDEKVVTEILNPSPRVEILMRGISSPSIGENPDNGALVFLHHYIGNTDKMREIFEALDAAE